MVYKYYLRVSFEPHLLVLNTKSYTWKDDSSEILNFLPTECSASEEYRPYNTFNICLHETFTVSFNQLKLRWKSS